MTSTDKKLYAYLATTVGGNRLDDSLTMVAVEDVADCNQCSSCYTVPEKEPYVGFACGNCISPRVELGIRNKPILYNTCRACSITPDHGYLTSVQMQELMVYESGVPNVVCDDHGTFCERHQTAISFRVHITTIPINTEGASPAAYPRPDLGSPVTPVSPSSPGVERREDVDQDPPQGGGQDQDEVIQENNNVQGQVEVTALNKGVVSSDLPSTPVLEGTGGALDSDTIPPRFIRYAEKFSILIEELTGLADHILEMKRSKKIHHEMISRLDSDIKNACQGYGHTFQGFLNKIQIRSAQHPTREEFTTLVDEPWYESYLLSVQEKEERLAELAHSAIKLKKDEILTIGIHPSRRVTVSQEEAEKPSPQDSTSARSQSLHEESSEEKKIERATERLPSHPIEVDTYVSEPSDNDMPPMQYIPTHNFVGICRDKNCDYSYRVRSQNACIYQHNPRQYALNKHPEFLTCLDKRDFKRLAEMRGEIKRTVPKLNVLSPPRVTPKRDANVFAKTCHVCNETGHIRKNCPNRNVPSSSPQGDNKVPERGSAITQPLVPKGIHILSYRKKGTEDVPIRVFRPSVTYTKAGYPHLPNVPEGCEVTYMLPPKENARVRRRAERATKPRKMNFEPPSSLPEKEVGEKVVEPSLSPNKVDKRNDPTAEKASTWVSVPCSMDEFERRQNESDEMYSEKDLETDESSSSCHEIHEGPANARTVRLQRKKKKGPAPNPTKRMKSADQCDAVRRRKKAARHRRYEASSIPMLPATSEKKDKKREAPNAEDSEKNEKKRRIEKK